MKTKMIKKPKLKKEFIEATKQDFNEGKLQKKVGKLKKKPCKSKY